MDNHNGEWWKVRTGYWKQCGDDGLKEAFFDKDILELYSGDSVWTNIPIHVLQDLIGDKE